MNEELGQFLSIVTNSLTLFLNDLRCARMDRTDEAHSLFYLGTQISFTRSAQRQVIRQGY